jgi:hypothetical protein
MGHPNPLPLAMLLVAVDIYYFPLLAPLLPKPTLRPATPPTEIRLQDL